MLLLCDASQKILFVPLLTGTSFIFFSEHGPPLEQALPSRLHDGSPPQLGGGHGGAVGRGAEDAAAAKDQGKVHSHTGA